MRSFREEIDGIPARRVPKAEKLSVTRTPSFLGVSVETLVEGLPGRRSIRRLFRSLDAGVRRPGGDKEEEREQATVCLVPLGPISLVWLRLRRAVGPDLMGLISGAKRLTAFRSFVFHTRKPCCPKMVPTASSMRWSSELDDPAIAESQGQTPGRCQIFGTRTTPRKPESGRRAQEGYGAFYTVVGLVQVAAL